MLEGSEGKLVKKKQTNKQARTDAEQEKRKLLAKDDKAFSFGRALLLKVEACYTCGLRAFAPGREEIFNTLIKSRLRISTWSSGDGGKFMESATNKLLERRDSEA